MKNIFLISLLSLLGFSAQASTELGNGGDAVLQQFNLRGLQMAAYLEAEVDVAAKYSIDAVKFRDVVKKTILSAQERLFKADGTEVDALNYPMAGRIEVSRSRWLQNEADVTRTHSIALHEYLWVYGINDENYLVSNAILVNFDKSVGRILEPELQKQLLQSLCDRIWSVDFTGGSALLGWGLNLNASCQSDLIDNRKPYSPFDALLFTYLRSLTPNEMQGRDELARELLVYGADPNQPGGDIFSNLLYRAFEHDKKLAALLLSFGADPNAMYDGTTVFTQIALTSFSSGAGDLRRDDFELFLSAGADLNLIGGGPYVGRTAARAIVSKEFNADVVDAAIESGSVDWCTFVDPWNRRTLDWVRSEYLPLLTKHHVQCN